MPFLVYAAVVIATVFSVVLEWDALIVSAPSSRPAVRTTSVPATPATRSADNAEPVRAPAAPAPAAATGPTAAPVAQPAGQTTPPAAAVRGGESSGTAPGVSPTAEEPAAPRCDVEACAAAYGSFRASDCTWQPFEGPRRLCTKGAAAAPEAAANARAEGPPPGPLCHYRTCAEHYSSFNPSDCTYQPLDGPRRRCEK